VSPPKEAEARQTCPGFFLKSLLESPGNLLEICLIKFVDTLINKGCCLNCFVCRRRATKYNSVPVKEPDKANTVQSG